MRFALLGVFLALPLAAQNTQTADLEINGLKGVTAGVYGGALVGAPIGGTVGLVVAKSLGNQVDVFADIAFQNRGTAQQLVIGLTRVLPIHLIFKIGSHQFDTHPFLAAAWGAELHQAVTGFVVNGSHINLNDPSSIAATLSTDAHFSQQYGLGLPLWKWKGLDFTALAKYNRAQGADPFVAMFVSHTW